MRVAYDAAPLQLATAGELRYTTELLAAMSGRGDVEVDSISLPVRRPGSSLQRTLLQGVYEGYFYPLRFGRRARGASLVHFPRPLVPPMAGLQAPRVVTIHDMFPLTEPQLFSAAIRHHHTWLVPRAARRADAIITGSEFCKGEIVATTGVIPDRVHVTPWGVAPRFRPVGRDPDWLRERFGIDRPFLMCLGTLEPRKNLTAALEAFLALPAERQELLVIVGGQGWRNTEFERAARSTERVVLTGYVDDEELVRLLAAAECFLYPSLSEGFGFPVLEAMAAGTPVVSSKAGSLAEVVADAGLLVDPRRPEELAAAVLRVLESETRAADLRARGLARAAEFTWARCAEQTVEVYRAVAG